MLPVWKTPVYTLQELNNISVGTMAETLEIRFTVIGENYLEATMPINSNSRQPYGLLHGGASAAMAETVGSVAASMCIDREKQICVGLEINCNHIRGKKEGIVTARATPLHVGASTHVWDIKINDERGSLVCVSRLTMAILKKH